MTDYSPEATPIRVGIAGTGFSAAAHADALRRIPGVTVAAVASRSSGRARQLASTFDIPAAVTDWSELLQLVDVVHNCTSTSVHTEVNIAALEAGKHILCEKPLGTSPADAAEVMKLAAITPVVTATCFQYRYYSLIRHLRSLLASSDAPPVQFIRGSYLQDWLLLADEWNWRLDAGEGGPSLAMADVGSHWFDLIRFITAQPVKAVLADLRSLHRTRRQSGSDGDVIEHDLERDEYGSVLARTAGGALVSFSVSQVSPGNKNRLQFEMDTRTEAYSWDQEQPNKLGIGYRESANRVFERGSVDDDTVSSGVWPRLPPGHPEGWSDAMRSLFTDFYAAVAAHRSGKPGEGLFATFADGYDALVLTESVLESSQRQAWVDVDRQRTAAQEIAL